MEFFKMIVLAVKVNYPEMDRVCLLDSDEMYQKAKDEKVPFYKFYDWIKEELDTQCMQIIYSFNKKN